MVFRQLRFVPALYKIFDEVLVNANDHKVRDPSVREIRVNFDETAGRVTVWNDGSGIPIEWHRREEVWVPELIFGHLLTSSNYDDDEKKVTGGGATGTAPSWPTSSLESSPWSPATASKSTSRFSATT